MIKHNNTNANHVDIRAEIWFNLKALHVYSFINYTPLLRERN